MNYDRFLYFRKFFVLLLLFSFLIVPFKLKAQDQRAIVITADQPNIWTLEQAHYLLAQMHRRNLDLKASSLTELDPNAINGVNVDVLKTLLEVTAEYDQAKALNNNLRKNQKQFDGQRRQELIERRARLQDESLTLTRQIAELKIRAIQANNDVDQQKIRAQITELEIVQAAVKEQVSQINTELGTLTGVTGDFEKPTLDGGFDKTKLAGDLDSTFSSAVKTVVEGFNKTPQLNASLRLENYLQMQYEILSKQLTLLRDEVGPGERLIFLEMPQSIRASYDKSDKKWAQSWWKIRAYTTCEEMDSEYENTSFKMGDVAGELRKIKQEFGTFQNFVQTELPAAYTDVQAEFNAAGENLKGAIDKTEEAAVFGKQVSKVLENNEQVYLAEKTETKKQVVQMLTEALVAADKSVLSVQETIKDKARFTSKIPKLKDADKEKTLKDQFDIKVKSLETTIDGFKSGEMRKTHLAWWKLKIPVFVKPVTKLVAEIDEKLKELGTENLIKLGAGLTGDEIAPLLLDSISENRDSKPCKMDSYLDTSSVIRSLIKNDDYRRVKVEDLDEKLTWLGDGADSPTGELNKSPLLKILAEDNRKIQTQAGTEISENKGQTVESQKYLQLENREARIVDLFPRQSSLNVNDIKYRSNAFSLKLLFSLISGFGAKANYQRSRERYSQFVQQELYSSAFGKGSREFGWTFNPMPGTKRLMSGVRTTYAIMVVPQKATTVILQTTGCYFKRSERQMPDFENALQFQKTKRLAGKGECSQSKSFIVPIPVLSESENNFWVQEIKYEPVEPSRRVVVSIRGKDFSTQVGVLVDGVALKPALGLGQPFIIDDSRTNKEAVPGDTNIKGSFERVSSNQIIASFEMGKDYRGTPTITLIAPGKGLVLNSLTRNQHGLSVIVDGTGHDKLDKAPLMFGRDAAPDKSDARISGVKLFKAGGGKLLTAVITGENLLNVTSIDANGSDCDFSTTRTPPPAPSTGSPSTTPSPTPIPPAAGVKSESLIRCTFDNTGEKRVYLTLLAGKKSLQSAPIDNPSPQTAEPDQPPSIAGYNFSPSFSVTQVEFQNTQEIANSTDVYAWFKLTGTGFPEKIRVDKGAIEFISPTEAMFRIERSKTPTVITIIDDGNKLKAKREITGEPAKPPRRTRAKKNS
jgi:hypothetical protein